MIGVRGLGGLGLRGFPKIRGRGPQKNDYSVFGVHIGVLLFLETTL